MMRINSNSQIGQDLFVLKHLANKRNGIFVDIGAGHPIKINNTYLLEKDYEWSGISLDYGHGKAYGCKKLSDDEYKKLWKSNRKTPLILCDALSVDFNQLFKEHNLPNEIDYLDLDIEPPKATLECLFKIPFDKYKINIITFEHDDYKDKTNKEPGRNFLLKLGYIYVQSNATRQEDWYILPEILNNLT
jgi:hypothetical protein